ncbi:recombinase family protein [Streptomyces malaysiensis]|uniref:hypothetical protein n=1 Tax=Streptomyces malaysiensis TaxID=92644 RepID=UPI002B2A256C|nr:hypothetical protein R8789_02465 [Streptomyces malaysiensis]
MGSPEAIRVWAQKRRIAHSAGAAGASDAQPQLMRVAWMGRTSNRDLQDPTLSLPRQLRNCQQVLPEGALIVVHFYGVESGRMSLAQRGRGHAHEQFQIPIPPGDGSIQDLLEEAERSDRRFDAVICESVERIARTAYFGTKIEYELEQAGVPLLASDEPIRADARSPLPVSRMAAISPEHLQDCENRWFGSHVSKNALNLGLLGCRRRPTEECRCGSWIWTRSHWVCRESGQGFFGIGIGR